MKGQFMVVSAVVISLIVLSAVSTIGKIQSTTHEIDKDARYVNMIQDEAKKVQAGDKRDIENFKRMLDTIRPYDVESVYWSGKGCFNVTMYSPGTTIGLRCVPVN